MRYFVFFLLTVSLLPSCQKTLQEPNDKGPDNYDLVISLDKNESPNGGSNISYSFIGNVTDGEVSEVEVNEHLLNYDNQDHVYSLISEKDSTLLRDHESEYFGQNISIRFDQEKESVYLPAIIQANFTNCNAEGNFVKSEGIDIEWEIDHQSSVNPVVVIVVEYDPNKFSDEEGDVQPIFTRKFIVNEAEGRFFIDPSELEDIPSGSMPTIHIGRRSTVESVTGSGRKFLFFNVQHSFGRRLL